MILNALSDSLDPHHAVRQQLKRPLDEEETALISKTLAQLKTIVTIEHQELCYYHRNFK